MIYPIFQSYLEISSDSELFEEEGVNNDNSIRFYELSGTSSAAPQPSSSSASAQTESPMFAKRGVKAPKKTLSEEALKILKQMSDSALPPPPLDDTSENFGRYVASKLREMNLVKRNRCEQQIIQVLCNDEQ